ncbi:hypothetical protein B566_EDAN009449 [Ephemera danica]|nr:hypothetical protein B566_EDAN009449 [Ephemera danica]
MLSASELSAAHRRSLDQTLPAKGVKQYEPTGSWLETDQLAKTLEERKTIIQVERVDKWNLLSSADWLPEENVAEVTRKVGKIWQTMGTDKGGRLLLQPEEALYMLENSLLELKLCGVAVSVQQAYSILIGSHCTLPEYRTYSKLLRCGMLVQRHRTTPSPSPVLKRASQDPTIEPPAKRRNTSAVDDNIEVISLDEDDPNKFPFIPNIIGKDSVQLNAPPENLIPSNIKLSSKEYKVNLKNLKKPDYGSKPVPQFQQCPQPNWVRGYNMSNLPNLTNFAMNSVRQTGWSLNFAEQNYRNYFTNFRFMQIRPNAMPFMKYSMNINAQSTFYNPFAPRLNLYQQQFNRFHMPQQISQSRVMHAMHMRSPLRQNNSKPTRPVNEREVENLTPPPNPRVPKLKAKSWAEVKAKLSNTVEIITLDEDDEVNHDDEEDLANTTINQSLVQPEHCKSLGNATENVPSSDPVGVTQGVPVLYAVVQPDCINFYCLAAIELLTSFAT